MIDLDLALKTAVTASQRGRQVLTEYFGKLSRVSEKDQAGLVSEADIESEKIVSQILLENFPDTIIYGEEGSYLNPDVQPDNVSRKKGLWLIDPLDGTTNYVHQFPIYCVSIGLEYDGELVLGVIDVPALNKTYTAVKGRGAYVNGQKINVSERMSLAESLLATGFSSYDNTRAQLEIFGSLVPDVRGVRRAGSAAFDLCMVAEGVFDAYWEKNLSPWDTAAGVVLVREAGGIVTAYDSETFDPFDKSIVAGSPSIQHVVKERINKISAAFNK